MTVRAVAHAAAAAVHARPGARGRAAGRVAGDSEPFAVAERCVALQQMAIAKLAMEFQLFANCDCTCATNCI